MWKLFEPLHAVTYFADECLEEYRSGGPQGLLDGLLRRSRRTHGSGGARRGRRHLLQLQSRPGQPGPPRRLVLRRPRPGPRRPPGRRRPRLRPHPRARRGRGRPRSDGDMARAAELARCRGRGAAPPTVGPWRPPTSRWPGPRSPTWRCGRPPPCCASTAATGTSSPSWRRDSTVARRSSPWPPPARCRERCSRRPGVGTTTPGTRATGELIERGWLDEDGTHTASGSRRARQEIEDLTDLLAAEPWERLGEDDTEALRAVLTPLARAIAAAGSVPVPNPIGLPPAGVARR